MIQVTDEEHQEAATLVKNLLATYRDAEDLIQIGAYVRGTNPRLDYAIDNIERINSFLRQRIEEKAPFEESVERLKRLLPEPPPEYYDE
ncbi:MAG: hypothetical protein KatS3mg115_1562 [Candidatus Poribacteria bacterium]|nr:MAG: hypothetical protein KatS3mg115_1562 [Candidatus Poribacteria bacterium]